MEKRVLWKTMNKRESTIEETLVRFFLASSTPAARKYARQKLSGFSDRSPQSLALGIQCLGWAGTATGRARSSY